MDDAVSRIKELEKQLDDANSKNQADAQTINDLNAQIQDLSTYKAVSYTHLDVYKRQIHMICLLRKQRRLWHCSTLLLSGIK